MKHPELSGLLTQFGTTFMKGDGGRRAGSAHVEFNEKNDGGKYPRFAPVRNYVKSSVRNYAKSDGGKNPRFAPVKNNVKGHGGETPQSAPVTKPYAPFLAKFYPRH